MLIHNDVHYFRSIYDFINTVKPARRIDGRCYASEKEDSGWSGSKSLAESWHWLENGCPELMELYKKVSTNIEIENMCQQERLNVVGYQVNIPLYLMGVEVNMLTRDRKTFKSKIINIVINTSVSGVWGVEDIIRYALAVFKEVVALESEGYRVNLYKMIGSSSYDGSILGFIKMKNDREKINIPKMIFPLCHPSMQRRLDFYFRECFGKDDVTHDGYGRQSDWNKKFVEQSFKLMCKENFIWINLHEFQPMASDTDVEARVKQCFEGEQTNE